MKPIFTQQKQYVVFDWSNLVYRAFSVRREGGFLELTARMLLKQRAMYPGAHFVIALEGGGEAIRKRILPRYKAQRERTEEAGRVMRISLELLSYLSCTVIKAKFGEADDAIATFVKKNRNSSSIVVVSEDHDLWQLIGPNVRMMRNRGEVTEYDCRKELGVLPAHVACLKALIGDASDNVPRAIPRMRSEVLTRLARCGKTPAEACRSAKKTGAVEQVELDKVVRNKERVITNYRVVKLQDQLEMQQQIHQADARKLLGFLKQHHIITIDPAAANAIAGQTGEAS